MERKLTDPERIEAQNVMAMMMTEMPKHRHEYEHEDLPLEGFDHICQDPVDLQKIMDTLCEDLGRLDGIAVTANRFSERYMSVSLQLEKLVRQVGSMFLTFAVLEQQGRQIRYPEDLSVRKLYDIAGYHFNKAHLAVKGTQLYNLRFYLGMLSQEVRWAVLLGRLNATEKKIAMIREGKLIVDAGKQTCRKTEQYSENKTADPAAGPLKSAAPAALPVCRDLIRLQNEQSGSITEAPRKFPEMLPLSAEPAFPDTSEEDIFLPEGWETTPEDEDNEYDEKHQKRFLLMDEARDRDDTEAFERVCLADSQTLELLWEAFVKADRKNGFSYIRNSGYYFMGEGGAPPDWIKAVMNEPVPAEIY